MDIEAVYVINQCVPHITHYKISICVIEMDIDAVYVISRCVSSIPRIAKFQFEMGIRTPAPSSARQPMMAHVLVESLVLSLEPAQDKP